MRLGVRGQRGEVLAPVLPLLPVVQVALALVDDRRAVGFHFGTRMISQVCFGRRLRQAPVRGYAIRALAASIQRRCRRDDREPRARRKRYRLFEVEAVETAVREVLRGAEDHLAVGRVCGVVVQLVDGEGHARVRLGRARRDALHGDVHAVGGEHVRRARDLARCGRRVEAAAGRHVVVLQRGEAAFRPEVRRELHRLGLPDRLVVVRQVEEPGGLAVAVQVAERALVHDVAEVVGVLLRRVRLGAPAVLHDPGTVACGRGRG